MCGATLAELHEHDLLAMGVKKLGHRKIIMQAIRVLFDQGDDGAGGGETVVLEPAMSTSHDDLPDDAALALKRGTEQETSDKSQEQSGTV